MHKTGLFYFPSQLLVYPNMITITVTIVLVIGQEVPKSLIVWLVVIGSSLVVVVRPTVRVMTLVSIVWLVPVIPMVIIIVSTPIIIAVSVSVIVAFTCNSKHTMTQKLNHYKNAIRTLVFAVISVIGRPSLPGRGCWIVGAISRISFAHGPPKSSLIKILALLRLTVSSAHLELGEANVRNIIDNGMDYAKERFTVHHFLNALRYMYTAKINTLLLLLKK